MVHLQGPVDDIESRGAAENLLTNVAQSVCCMLNAEGAGIIFLSSRGLASATDLIVDVCRGCGLILSENKAEMMCMPACGDHP